MYVRMKYRCKYSTHIVHTFTHTQNFPTHPLPLSPPPLSLTHLPQITITFDLFCDSLSDHVHGRHLQRNGQCYVPSQLATDKVQSQLQKNSTTSMHPHSEHTYTYTQTHISLSFYLYSFQLITITSSFAADITGCLEL